jgi:hypothetical protein
MLNCREDRECDTIFELERRWHTLKKLFCFAVAAALYWSNQALAVDAPDCALKQIASLPITTTSTGKIAVPVKIAGRDVLMAVELGASTTGINANLIDELKLDTRPIPGAYVPPDLDDVLLIPSSVPFIYQDNVFTGGMNIAILRKVALPDFQIGDGIVGILGTELLQHFDVELDFANAKMNLYSQDHCAGKVVYWANEYTTVPIEINSLTGEIMAPVTLDGAPFTATLATDPGNSYMSFGVIAKALDVPIDSPDLKPTHHFDPYKQDWFSYPFKSLSLGGLGLQNPPIDLVSSDGCTQIKLYGASIVSAAYDDRLRRTEAFPPLFRVRRKEALHHHR